MEGNIENIVATLKDSPSSPALLPGGEGSRTVEDKNRNNGPNHALGGGYRDEDLAEFSKVTGRLRKVPEGLIVRARELRERQTPSEKILWECLRDRQLLDAKFRRQHNVGPYIADFYCHRARLVVEVDGRIHLTQQVEDANRNEWMRSQRLAVLRFTNDAVQNEIEKVLETIVATLKDSPSSPTLLPGGEGNRTAEESI